MDLHSALLTVDGGTANICIRIRRTLSRNASPLQEQSVKRAHVMPGHVGTNR